MGRGPQARGPRPAAGEVAETPFRTADCGLRTAVFPVIHSAFRVAHALLTGETSKPSSAPIAQLDRASGYEPGGRTFESCWAHQPRFVNSGDIGNRSSSLLTAQRRQE